MTPDQYLVPESRQTFGYGVAYHLTGNTGYLDWMKAGVQYIRQNMIDPAGGMFLSQDLTNNTWGPDRAFRDPQQLGYGVLCLAFYYYLTRDDTVLPDILALKNYILGTYYNTQLGTMQWLLQSNDGTAYNSKQLVADLDQMNTYLVLLAPILPEPSQTEWKQSLTTLSGSILGVFYSPGDNLLFTQADSPADTDLTKTGVDLGHTSKGLWMMRWTGLMTGDNGLADFATAAGRRHLTRRTVPGPAACSPVGLSTRTRTGGSTPNWTNSRTPSPSPAIPPPASISHKPRPTGSNTSSTRSTAKYGMASTTELTPRSATIPRPGSGRARTTISNTCWWAT
jgi:hypothetical protein